MKKRGRKSQFNQKIQKTVLRLLKDRKKPRTEEEIAEVIGVSRKTLQNWRGAHPDFAMAVREAKQMADELVEASLFSRAVGYSHEEEKAFCTKDEVGSPTILTHTSVRHYAPDTQAAMFWLRNRQPDRWREKNESDVTVNNTIQVEKLSDEELEAQIAALLSKHPKA